MEPPSKRTEQHSKSSLSQGQENPQDFGRENSSRLWKLACKWLLGAEIFKLARILLCNKTSGGRDSGRFKNNYELLNLRALKISMLYKNHIFQCPPPPSWRQPLMVAFKQVSTATFTLRPRQERPPTTGGCLGGGWAHGVLSTGDLRVLLRCVVCCEFCVFKLLVLLPPILIANSNLLPLVMLFYPCSFYRACLCIMVIAMTAHSIGR